LIRRHWARLKRHGNKSRAAVFLSSEATGRSMRNCFLRLAAVAVLATGALWAQAPVTTPTQGAGTQPAHRLGAGLRPGRLIRTLNLSAVQRDQARSIFQQARQTAKPVRQQLQQNRQTLENAVISGNTGAEIQQLATEQGTLLGQMLAIRSQAWSQLFNSLTPDQRTQATKTMQ
jgi:exonuclease VII small subunit